MGTGFGDKIGFGGILGDKMFFLGHFGGIKWFFWGRVWGHFGGKVRFGVQNGVLGMFWGTFWGQNGVWGHFGGKMGFGGCV